MVGFWVNRVMKFFDGLDVRWSERKVNENFKVFVLSIWKDVVVIIEVKKMIEEMGIFRSLILVVLSLRYLLYI